MRKLLVLIITLSFALPLYAYVIIQTPTIVDYGYGYTTCTYHPAWCNNNYTAYDSYGYPTQQVYIYAPYGRTQGYGWHGDWHNHYNGNPNMYRMH